MERSIDVHLHLRYDRKSLRPWLAAAFLLLTAGDLASESVSLSTYYPAPSGVYTQLIATSVSYLARDAGYVDVGTTAALPAGTKMSVMGGSVGIGTTSPGNALQIVGGGNSNVDLAVNGRIQTGDGGSSGGVWLSNAGNMFVGQDGTNLGLYTAGAGWGMVMTQGGFVGIGNNSPSYPLDVGTVAGNPEMRVGGIAGVGCYWIAFGNSGATSCWNPAVENVLSVNYNGGPLYIGGYSPGVSYTVGNSMTIYTTGTMLCCRIHP